MIQQFIHTIAKEEIAKLTVEEFKGRIITILSKEGRRVLAAFSDRRF